MDCSISDSHAMDTLLLANAFSSLEKRPPRGHDNLSRYEDQVSAMEQDPNDHSSAYLTPEAMRAPEDLEYPESFFAEYQTISQNNPYYTETEWKNDLTALTPMKAGSSDQSPVSSESSARDLLGNEPHDLTEFSAKLDMILKYDKEKHESLVPAYLSLPVKRGPEHSTRIISPDLSNRPRSHKASVSRSDSALSWQRSHGIRSSVARSSFAQIIDSISESNYSNRSSTTVKGPVIIGKKNLFGPDGLLGPFPGTPDEPMEPLPSSSPKEALFRGLSKKIKQQITEIHPANPFTTTPTGATRTILPVSLTPSAQGRLYSDLEMMICETANSFLLHQYYDGRVSQQSINKLLHQWAAKGRPQVNQFRFDQVAQRELIMENRRTLALSAEYSTNTVQFHTHMRNWKAITVEMTARTFCLPDSAVRKNLYEIHGILDMLNAPTSIIRDFNMLNSWVQSQMVEASELSRSQSLNHMSY